MRREESDAFAYTRRIPTELGCLLLAMKNAGAGWCLRRRFADAGTRIEAHPQAAGILFFIDLLGAACGLLLGSVVLVWWVGFRDAAILCAAAAVLGHCFSIFRRPADIVAFLGRH